MMRILTIYQLSILYKFFRIEYSKIIITYKVYLFWDKIEGI